MKPRVAGLDRHKFGPWAVVTGASSGTGEEFARQLAASGLNLVLVARRLSALESLGQRLAAEFGVEYHAVGIDLSDDNVLDELEAATHDLDVGPLISNAGAVTLGEFLAHDGRALHAGVRLNVMSHVVLAQHFGKCIAARGRGGVLTVSSTAGNKRIDVGSVVTPRELLTIADEFVHVPDTKHLTHLQFRRYAGCPFCNLHLWAIALRHDEIVAAGVREVVVFHSTAAELRSYQSDQPFAVIADPDKRLYADFGVEASGRALLAPGAWVPGLRGMWRALRDRRLLGSDMHGGALGLPADFLICA
jgi:hypothetical protein